MNVYNHISAIFIKQIKDSLKNPLTIVVFFMFPILSYIFKGLVSDEEFAYLLPSFMTMNTVMLPIIFMSSIVSEEKEKQSLRMLIMSNVKAWEYMVGIGICVFAEAMLSTCLFLLLVPLTIQGFIVCIVAAVIGICCSMLIGAILAVFSKNQMSVGPLCAPISMILGLLPMFSAMNDTIEHIAKIFYSYYVRKMFVSLHFEFPTYAWAIIGTNIIVLFSCFAIFYKHKGLVNE